MTDAFVLRQAAVLDESGGFGAPEDVLVEDGRIVAVGPRLTAGDASEVDCSGLWLLPGIADCHSHLAVSSLDPLERMRTPVTQWALEAARNARRILECGVTLLRDPGGADAGIRDAIAAGHVVGPRLQVAVVTLCQTGGHADGYLQGAGVECSADYVAHFPGRPPYLVDGPDEMRKTVRRVLRAGADWIKLCSTGGVLSPHDDGDMPELTEEEIGVAVFETERRGKGVMAHAFGGEGLENAVRAGVRSIEHGIFLTEEQAALMAGRDCFLVPTLFVVREVIGWAEQAACSRRTPNRRRSPSVTGSVNGSDRAPPRRQSRSRQRLRPPRAPRPEPGRAPLAARGGSDGRGNPAHSDGNGTELLGVADRLGRIAPGYLFDAILLDEEPGNLSLFAEPGAVAGVLEHGQPVVRHPRHEGLSSARSRAAAAR